eukprot:g31058.t1
MGKAGKKKAEKKGGIFDVGNLIFLAIAAAIGYCRYNQINIPILDDFIRKALYGDAGGQHPRPGSEATYSLPF